MSRNRDRRNRQLDRAIARETAWAKANLAKFELLEKQLAERDQAMLGVVDLVREMASGRVWPSGIELTAEDAKYLSERENDSVASDRSAQSLNVAQRGGK